VLILYCCSSFPPESKQEKKIGAVETLE